MSDLGAVWETDLAVLAQSGGEILARPDHLVIRTPANPTFHWGNFVLVTDPALAADADRCIALFRAAFPAATWTAIGLPGLPEDPTPWQRQGIDLEESEALSLTGAPLAATCPPGYSARPFQDADWAADVARTIRENERSGDFETEGHAEFVRRQSRQRRRLVAKGVAAWLGAFAGAQLVADLGIVACGRRARYQDVSTDPDHRGRGLASHLLGLAADWALARDCTELVIVTEATNPAGRLYRRAGFSLISGGVEAYRRS